MWTYFVRIDNVFIDTGNPAIDRSKLLRYLKEKNAEEKNFTILNTHLHEDHCGNNRIIQKKTGANIYAPSKRDNFDDVTLFYRFFWGKPKNFDCKVLDESFTGTSSGRKLKIIHTPGHTPCHVSYHLEEENLWITGDAIPLPLPKEYSMPEEDYKKGIETLKDLNNSIKGDALVIDGHRGMLRDPNVYIEVRIEKMEKIVEKVKNVGETFPTDKSRVIKEVFSKPTLFMRLAAPRYTLENTVRSILSD
jgi:glyoxylase-like metal-dependent hydrolase (beta-lactamase superfamily II)